MATIYSLVCENGSAGVYWSGLTAAEKSRYGDVGSERVYGGVAAWHAARLSDGVDANDSEVCEIGDSFTETVTGVLSISLGCYSTKITTMINGIRSSAFHGGIIGGGYVFYSASGLYAWMLNIYAHRVTIDGIEVRSGNNYAYGIRLNTSATYPKCSNLICSGNNTSTNTYGFVQVSSPGSIVYNCIFFNVKIGLQLVDYSAQGTIIYNCGAFNCSSYGFKAGANSYGFIYNCVSYGCGTNWGTAPGLAYYMSNNAGASGDAVWDSGSTSLTSVTFSDFIDYTNNDFRIASGSSLIDSGIDVVGGEWSDIVGNVRPNYDAVNYPDNNWDIGPFEYDHGNGLAPQQVTLSVSGMVEGSVLAIYKTSDGTALVSPTTIGTSGSYSTTYSYTGDTQIEVVVRKGTSGTKYLPYKAPGLITNTGFVLIVNQIEDTVLNG